MKACNSIKTRLVNPVEDVRLNHFMNIVFERATI